MQILPVSLPSAMQEARSLLEGRVIKVGDESGTWFDFDGLESMICINANLEPEADGFYLLVRLVVAPEFDLTWLHFQLDALDHDEKSALSGPVNRYGEGYAARCLEPGEYRLSLVGQPTTSTTTGTSRLFGVEPLWATHSWDGPVSGFARFAGRYGQFSAVGWGDIDRPVLRSYNFAEIPVEAARKAIVEHMRCCEKLPTSICYHMMMENGASGHSTPPEPVEYPPPPVTGWFDFPLLPSRLTGSLTHT